MTVLVLVALVTTCLTACAGRFTAETAGHIRRFAGIAAAGEPRAVLTARDVLSEGGNAVDAAVALAFTLAVTFPVSAGLGGGGVCLVADPKAKVAETLEFLPHLSSQPQMLPLSQITAVPALQRGLFALHARYGRMRWESLLVPAETLARTGYDVSRALAHELAAVARILQTGQGMPKVLMRSNGGIVQEGDTVVQKDLAVLLAHLRVHGAEGLYGGERAYQMVEAVAAVGGTLTVEDLRDYVPRWEKTLTVPFGYAAAHFAPSLPDSSVVAQIWAGLAEENGNPAGSLTADQVRLVGRAAATRTMAANLAQWQPGETGFVVMDHEGMAVACTLTMNGPLGSWKIAMGILLAAHSDFSNSNRRMTPMLIIKRNVPETILAGTISGGGGAAVLATTVAWAVLGHHSLSESIAGLHAGVQPDSNAVGVEMAVNATLVQELRRQGYAVATTEGLGQLNVAFCPDGLPPVPETCQVVTDPRGHGLAIMTGSKGP